MALVIVVEDGTIVTGANSYLSVADADAIIEVDFRLWPIWDARDTETKEQLLMLATRYLDEWYIWNGRKVQLADPDAVPPVVAQRLQWPRKGVRDCSGCAIGEGVIPEELQKATAYLAVWLWLHDPEAIFEQSGIKRFRNDTVEIEWQDNFGGISSSMQPSFFTRLLECFGTGPGERGFKPIIRK